MTKLFPEQLAASLAQGVRRLYFLVGQDPLLLGESKDQISRAAAALGFEEKTDIIVDNQTDWAAIIEQCQSIGLFSARQLLILNFPENLTALLQKNLAELMPLLHEDLVLVLQFDKLGKTQEKQTWFQLANQYAPDWVQVNCQTPALEHFPRWVKQRAAALGLEIEQEAVQLLCYSYENNLLALKQALQLLSLLYPDNRLSYPRVKEVVEQSSQFSPYQWIDALFEGKENRAKRILNRLQQEDVQPVVLLRILQRELMLVLQLAQPQQKVGLDTPLPHSHLKGAFDQLKIWQNRRPLFLSLLQRLDYGDFYRIWRELAAIERAVKQDFSADVWAKLQDLSLKICLGRKLKQL